ncbi:MAG: Phosphopantetheine adenylyltransferase [Calditrichaeota bacterium]|nr:Phosphopantetheine adenylyltransferase [Calditrichota bacterium]
MDKQRTAVYPGTFDPITNGHLDILRRACDLFDGVTVCIARNPSKEPMFRIDDRFAMISEALDEVGLDGRVQVETFDGLIVDYADSLGAIALIRGLRAVSDFEFEFQMALMNRHLNSRLHTVYLMPKDEHTYLSSSIVKNVARHGGDIRPFVPSGVARRLMAAYGHTLGE